MHVHLKCEASTHGRNGISECEATAARSSVTIYICEIPFLSISNLFVEEEEEGR